MYVIAEDPIPAAITLDLAKSHLRVTHDAEDDVIEAYALSATQFVEAFSGVRLVERVVILQATIWDGRWRLPKGTKVLESASFNGAARTDGTLVAGFLRFPDGIAVAGPCEIALRVGVAASAADLPAQYRGPLLAALGHLYTSREGQDFPAGIYAMMRGLPGGGIRL